MPGRDCPPPSRGPFKGHILDEVDAAWPFYERFYDRQVVVPGAREPVLYATTEEISAVESVWVVFEEYGEATRAASVGTE